MPADNSTTPVVTSNNTASDDFTESEGVVLPTDLYYGSNTTTDMFTDATSAAAPGIGLSIVAGVMIFAVSMGMCAFAVKKGMSGPPPPEVIESGARRTSIGDSKKKQGKTKLMDDEEKHEGIN